MCNDAEERLVSGKSETCHQRVVVIGLGSRYRGDDGIGEYVLEGLRNNGHDNQSVMLVDGVDDALAIISAWEDTDLAVVIDAAQSGAIAGTIHYLKGDSAVYPRGLAACSSHGLGLAEALKLGRLLKRMPGRLLVYAVEVGQVDAGTTLSDPVRVAGDTLRRIVGAELAPYAGVDLA